MTIVQCIENLTDWINENVCPKILLKRPSDERQDTLYRYEEVNPTAYSMFLPGTDKLPEGTTSQFPSILVQFVEGTHTRPKFEDRYNIQLSFIAWNPGTHPDENGMTEKYRRGSDGWKDVWVLLDRTLTEIENAEYMNGLRLVKEEEVKYGQFTKDGQISDTYPYYYAWATFTVENGLNRKGAEYADLL